MPIIFIIACVLVFAGLNSLVAYFLVNWSSGISVVHFFVMLPINIGVAYGLCELAFSVMLKKKKFPALDELSNFPKVALLYVTCDDAIPEVISALKKQSYENCDVYILDDSTQDQYRNLVDEYGKDTRILRREDKRGFKAGNLNNWLYLYGDQYDYFSVADSDSLLPSDFIENMMKYAEHPLNENVAIFQSKIRPWNTENRFVETLSAMFPLWLYTAEKTGHRLKTLLSWGHNDLISTKCIKKIGGYDEAFVSEDFAASLYLLEKGYEIIMVDIESYEAIPNSPQSYAKRQIRYGKQDFQILKLLHLSIPVTTKLKLIMNAYSYAIWFIFSIGAFLAVWGYSSSFGEVLSFIRFILSGSFLDSPFLAPLLVIAFYIFYFTLIRLPLALKLKISAKEYFSNLLLTIAIGFYTGIPLLKALIKTLLGEKVKFDVTDKSRGEVLSPLQLVWEIRMLLAVTCVLVIGLMKNPMAVVFNFPWLLPLIFTPLIINVFTSDLAHAKMDAGRVFAVNRL